MVLSGKRDSMAKLDASMPECALLSTSRQIKGCAECKEEKEKNLLEIFAHLTFVLASGKLGTRTTPEVKLGRSHSGVLHTVREALLGVVHAEENFIMFQY